MRGTRRGTGGTREGSRSRTTKRRRRRRSGIRVAILRGNRTGAPMSMGRRRGGLSLGADGEGRKATSVGGLAEGGVVATG